MKKALTFLLMIIVAAISISACALDKPDTIESTTLVQQDNSQTALSDTSTPDSTEVEQEQPGATSEIITPEKAKRMLNSDQEVLLLDVRSQAEYNEIHIPGSMLIPVDELENRLEEISSWRDKPVILYCRSGRRSALAASILVQQGFTSVYDLGGIYDWPYETESA